MTPSGKADSAQKKEQLWVHMVPPRQVYGENPEFFSPYMFFSRPKDKEVPNWESEASKMVFTVFTVVFAILGIHLHFLEALQPGSDLWTVSTQCASFIEALGFRFPRDINK